MQNKIIPQEDLCVALLDDDLDGSCRPGWFYSFFRNFGLYLKYNFYLTSDIKKFIVFANNHRDALLFCDPGSLGECQVHGVDFKEDRIMAKWLEDNPSRILYVPYLMPIQYYSFLTFELKHNVCFFGSEFQWKINQIMYKWLFEHDPLALFIDEFALDCAHEEYIKKLKEPVLTKICERFGLKGKTIKERKQAVSKYYTEVWKKEMRKRGVKGY